MLQVLLVTGGIEQSVSQAPLSSTEVYRDSKWSFGVSLPSPRYAHRAATVGNSIFVTGKLETCYKSVHFCFSGGFADRPSNPFVEILRYDPSTPELTARWTVAGNMTEGKWYHAVTPLVTISQFDDICSW